VFTNPDFFVYVNSSYPDPDYFLFPSTQNYLS